MGNSKALSQNDDSGFRFFQEMTRDEFKEWFRKLNSECLE